MYNTSTLFPPLIENYEGIAILLFYDKIFLTEERERSAQFNHEPVLQ
jgi:hypothetical protein